MMQTFGKIQKPGLRVETIFMKNLFERVSTLNNVMFSKWIARPWLVDGKKSFNNGTFKSWLLEDEVIVIKKVNY